MLQWIITYTLVALALFITIRHFFFKKTVKDEEEGGCSSCVSSSCGGCPLDELKQEIKSAQKLSSK